MDIFRYVTRGLEQVSRVFVLVDAAITQSVYSACNRAESINALQVVCGCFMSQLQLGSSNTLCDSHCNICWAYFALCRSDELQLVPCHLQAMWLSG